MQEQGSIHQGSNKRHRNCTHEFSSTLALTRSEKDTCRHVNIKGTPACHKKLQAAKKCVGEIVFPRERLPHCLSNTKCLVLNIQYSNIIQSIPFVFIYLRKKVKVYPLPEGIFPFHRQLT